MKQTRLSWEIVCLASLAMVMGFGMANSEIASAAALEEPEGRIVEIAPTANDDLPEIRENDPEEGEQSEQTAYWVGLRGRNVEEPVLRTQFQLAADMGVVIEQVVPESPAAKAGLRQHDILLRVNGEALQSMEQLSEVVRASEGKPLELRLIRLSKEETIVVVPEERSVDLLTEQSNRGFGFGGEGDMFGDLMQGRNNAFRIFPGAGLNFNGQWETNNALPGGYSVNITRKNNEPAKIVVKKGDETWTIEGDDDAALQELPEEIRARVKALSNNRLPGFNFGNLEGLEENLQFRMPRIFEEGNGRGFGFGNEQRDRVMERMEQLEQQLEEMRDRLDNGNDPQ